VCSIALEQRRAQCVVVRSCAQGHTARCTRACSNVYTCKSVCVKMGLCARANVSELERNPCIASALDRRVHSIAGYRNLKQKIKINKANNLKNLKFYTNNKTKQKENSAFSSIPPNLSDILFLMCQKLQCPVMRNQNVQRPRHPPNFNTNTHQLLTTTFSQMNKH
jgi:hypothetical protein